MSHKVRWTVPKIKQRLSLIEPLVYRQREALAPFRYLSLADPMSAPLVTSNCDDSGWEVLEPYAYWARPRTNFILRTTFQIPSMWFNTPIAFFLLLGEPTSFSHPETLIYIDGKPFAASDRHHQEVLIPTRYADGQPHLLALHGWSGNENRDGDQARLFMHPCEMVQLHQPTRDFITTARVTVGIAAKIPDENVAKGKLLNALDAAFIALDTRNPFGEAFYASVPEAHDILKSGITGAGAPLDVTIAAVGHAHIDVAWLWTLGQTRRKAGRTFHTVNHLMSQFPNYQFTQSQPQLYDYVRQDYPELFEKIKQHVAEGRWEPIGGMWVEADCNLSGGESLVRQFLLGRSFFRRHFGPKAESPVLWLPDVFGYSWALPQLIKKSGLEYFMTIKIGWNQYNRMPYDSFWWQGIDGTRVLTHFSTTPGEGSDEDLTHASTYNATATPGVAIGTWRNFQQKEHQTEMLMSYGYGDGGGGPTREMLENIREMRHFPAAPQMRHDKVINFFRNIEAQAGDKLPAWNGELYLEYHRGTYTTQARNKRANRKAEFALHDAEFLAAFAWIMDKDYDYPQQNINRAWELVCLNQFHDIIPGSSIADVYVESLQQYEEVQGIAKLVCEQALDVLARYLDGDILIVNPTSFEQNESVYWAHSLQPSRHDSHLKFQQIQTGTLIECEPVEPFSIRALKYDDEQQIERQSKIAAHAHQIEISQLSVDNRRLENTFIRVELDSEGDIFRIFDKVMQREILPVGAIANQFQAFEDRPMTYEAWDIDIFYDDKMWTSKPAEAIEVIEDGPLRATIEIKRHILNSAYTQRISLDNNSPQLIFDTEIDWRERNILLKVAFPVDILSPIATYDIQWGNVQRPTHRNTSWDWARFETSAQKWVNLSEGDYGVSLLNDCKYGHDIQDNIMRITLLRSPTNPDPFADLGKHQFKYALLPTTTLHKAVVASYTLNNPIFAINGKRGYGEEQLQLIACDNSNVIIETVKRAEDGNSIIVRLYENFRTRGTTSLRFGFPVKAAFVTNLLEENETELEIENNTVSIAYKPFEIVTIKLVPQRA